MYHRVLEARTSRKCMMNTKRPRVAAIGLSGPQLASIAPLCGDLREAASLAGYLRSYNWSETDVMVSGTAGPNQVDRRVNLMTIGQTLVYWPDYRSAGNPHYARTDILNTERELAVSPACPDLYKPLAANLSRQLGLAADPPAIMETTRERRIGLIETTSGQPVALRLVLPTRSMPFDSNSPRPIALILPKSSNISAWFRAFLCELHESDPVRVPQAPPRFIQPSDWYTPEEKGLGRSYFAHRI